MNQIVHVVPESHDGVIVRIYHEKARHFEMALEQRIQPGERVMLDHYVGAGETDHVIIRVHPGDKANEERDWVIWEDMK